ncbi:MAG: hypothetical protein K5930_05400 [Treponemataceae bacterium]|nr:hypothetical protein [Treponemataceae bacterium]
MLMCTCILFSLNAQTGSEYEGNGIDWKSKNIYIDRGEYKVFDKTGLVIVDEVTIKGSGIKEPSSTEGLLP